MRGEGLSWIIAKPFAHRGLHGDGIPENSIEAISAAVTRGFPVELDVQATADGCVVVFHDWNLLRLTGVDCAVVDARWQDLGKLRLGGTASSVPRLEEVLERVGGRVPLLIELKSRGSSRLLARSIAPLLTAYDGAFAVQSFNPWILGWFRRKHPAIPRGQLACAFDTDPMAGWKKMFFACYGMNWLSAPHFVGHRLQDLPASVPGLLRRFLPVLAWTITSASEAHRALLHADNFIFEGFLPGLPSVA